MAGHAFPPSSTALRTCSGVERAKSFSSSPAPARPAGEMPPPQAVTALTKRARARPVSSDKERIAIRLDREALAHFKAGGPG